MDKSIYTPLATQEVLNSLLGDRFLLHYLIAQMPDRKMVFDVDLVLATLEQEETSIIKHAVISENTVEVSILPHNPILRPGVEYWEDLPEDAESPSD